MAARVSQPVRNLIPARAQGGPDALLVVFLRMLAKASATVTEVPSEGAVPAAIARYLASENLPASVVVAPALRGGIPWENAPVLEIRDGPPARDGDVAVTPGFAGIAETGTLMLLSGPESPTTLNFLPDTHVVVLRRDAVVGAYEDAWDRLRLQCQGPDGVVLPRLVNLVTGPSRTGDIEQKIQIGAHGPRRLHVVLVGR